MRFILSQSEVTKQGHKSKRNKHFTVFWKVESKLQAIFYLSVKHLLFFFYWLNMQFAIDLNQKGLWYHLYHKGHFQLTL